MNRGIWDCKGVRLDPSDRKASSLENLTGEHIFLSTVVLETVVIVQWLVIEVIIVMEKKNHQLQVNHKE